MFRIPVVSIDEKCYNSAIGYDIVLLHGAIADIGVIRKFDSTTILDEIETHLRHHPEVEQGSRIKRLRGDQPADFRLRVGDFRVFYRIDGNRVLVSRILSKDQTKEFYREEL